MVELNTSNMLLPDYINDQVDILSIGLNPSVPSAERGFYFANPRNRFWKAFEMAKIIDDELIIDSSVHTILLHQHAIGFTDVVKRVSRMGHELRAADFKRDAPLLREKIEKYQPRLLWFHGKIAIAKFMQYGYGIKQTWRWGVNQISVINAIVYVTPNPSPANAAYSLEDIITSYREIKYL